MDFEVLFFFFLFSIFYPVSFHFYSFFIDHFVVFLISFSQNVIREKTKNDAKFQFVHDPGCSEHYYYRWKIYSFTQGDRMEVWRTLPFQMIENGPVWIPPAIVITTLPSRISNKSFFSLDSHLLIPEKRRKDGADSIPKGPFLTKTEESGHFQKQNQIVSCLCVRQPRKLCRSC